MSNILHIKDAYFELPEKLDLAIKILYIIIRIENNLQE